MDTLIELIKLGSVGILAGLFSSFITNRDHRNKKWWELRIVAYQGLIEALSDLNHYFSSNYDAEIKRQDLDGARVKELKKYFDNSFQKIRVSADSGAFLFSDNVNESLQELMALKDTNFDSWFEYLDENLFITSKCLKSVVASSKVDLQVKSSWL